MGLALQPVAVLARALLLLAHTLRPRVTYYRLRGLYIYVSRGVFDPAISISSTLLAKLAKEHGEGLVFEVGAGAGLALLAASKTSGVLELAGVDSSPEAVALCRVNARVNAATRIACHTVSTSILGRYAGRVDVALVNPPYLPCRPRLPLEYAWCGGERLGITVTLVRLACTLLKPGGKLVAVLSTLTASKHSEPGYRGIALIVARACKGRRLKIEDVRRVTLPWREEILGIVARVH